MRGPSALIWPLWEPAYPSPYTHVDTHVHISKNFKEYSFRREENRNTDKTMKSTGIFVRAQEEGKEDTLHPLEMLQILRRVVFKGHLDSLAGAVLTHLQPWLKIPEALSWLSHLVNSTICRV